MSRGWWRRNRMSTCWIQWVVELNLRIDRYVRTQSWGLMQLGFFLGVEAQS